MCLSQCDNWLFMTVAMNEHMWMVHWPVPIRPQCMNERCYYLLHVSKYGHGHCDLQLDHIFHHISNNKLFLIVRNMMASTLNCQAWPGPNFTPWYGEANHWRDCSMSLLGCLADLNPQYRGPKPDALSTELSRSAVMSVLLYVIHFKCGFLWMIYCAYVNVWLCGN